MTFLMLFPNTQKLRWGYRNTGVYKALAEATVAGSESFTIVLSDLQTHNEALLEGASTQRERGVQTIVAQIGAAWRLSAGLEDAYAEYDKNNRTLRRLERLGVTVLDVRPERLVESIVQELSVSVSIPASRKPSR